MDGYHLLNYLKTYRYKEILFPKEPLRIQLNVDGQLFFLSICQKEILFHEKPIECEIFLTGSKSEMEAVFEGKKKLMEAIQLKRLQANGSYRRLLLLESILWLAGKGN